MDEELLTNFLQNVGVVIPRLGTRPVLGLLDLEPLLFDAMMAPCDNCFEDIHFVTLYLENKREMRGIEGINEVA